MSRPLNFYISSNRYGKYSVSSPDRRTMDGIVFDSRMEMLRYADLKLLEKAGEIRELSIQPKYELLEGFVRRGKNYLPIHYIGDFLYYDVKKKRKVVEDVKGVETEVFKIKQKLFAYRHNIELVLYKAI